MNIDECNSRRSRTAVERQPFSETVRAAIQALADSNRMRLSSLITCLRQGEYNALAEDVLATLTLRPLPESERNGAFYTAMCITGIRFCTSDTAALIISAHPVHTTKGGKTVKAFPDRTEELVFHNKGAVRVV